MVQLSNPHMTTGKTIVLTRWIFVDKVISLLSNMQSRLVITFLPRSKCLLISWLQSPSTVIVEPRKIKSATVSTVSPSICHEVLLLVQFNKPGGIGRLFASLTSDTIPYSFNCTLLSPVHRPRFCSIKFTQ